MDERQRRSRRKLVALLDAMAPRPVRRTSCRAKNVGEQGAPSPGSRAGAVCFGVRGGMLIAPTDT
jgi:hypothetical protein